MVKIYGGRGWGGRGVGRRNSMYKGNSTAASSLTNKLTFTFTLVQVKSNCKSPHEFSGLVRSWVPPPST